MNLEDFSGYIFMCNGQTKPECYMNRVFGLPAGRREAIEKIKPGMKLFLFDYEVKYLYGVYEATTAGRLNWNTPAFGGRFPAQVGFHIYEECLPLPESRFKCAIQDNYQTASRKFNPILSSQQVSHLISMFEPLMKPSSATYDHYSVNNQYQSHARNPLLSNPYSINLTNSSHTPQESVARSYSSMYGRLTSPALEPQRTQRSVYPEALVLPSYSSMYKRLTSPALEPQHTQVSVYPEASVPPSYSSMYGRLTSPALDPQHTQTSVYPEQVDYRYTGQMDYNYPAVQWQANSAAYQASYSVHAGQSQLYEAPKSYERYQDAGQAMVPTHQHTGWTYEYNQFPSQTNGGEWCLASISKPSACSP